MPNPLRVALVGAGGIAERYHLPSLRRLANEGRVTLAALCDVNPARAQEMAARFGFERVLTDYRALPDQVAPDAVWTPVPFPLMREIAGYFLARGLPTLMEKPPGANSAETRALRDIALTHGTPHQVAFNRRHAPLLLRMKALLAEVGPVQALSCQFYRHNRTEDYFPFGTGLHGLDALRFLAGSEVREVQTRMGSRGSVLVTLELEEGALALFEMLPQVGVQSERYTAHAGARTVVVDGVIGWLTLFPGFLQCFDAGELTLTVDNTADPQPPEVVSGFYGESAHFVQALTLGQPPAPDLATALRSVEIAEAVQRGESATFEA
jgi:myo-inositol 2-dehydrogenase / D-chiro-inositol 1-dehydrogenase